VPDIFIENSISNAQTGKKEQDTGHSELKKEGDPENVLNLEKNTKRHNHVLAAYCEHPREIAYSNILKEEAPLLFLRKHFVTNLPWIVKAVLLGLAPFIISIITGIFNITLFNFLPYEYIFLGLIFYYFVIFGYILVNYITWFYNISLVTTQRIVDIDFSHIVFENVSASKLGQIEDVHYQQVGVFASVFDYGDVTVQTAGTSVLGFDFHAAPHPEKVVHFINSLIGTGGQKNG